MCETLHQKAFPISQLSFIHKKNKLDGVSSSTDHCRMPLVHRGTVSIGERRELTIRPAETSASLCCPLLEGWDTYQSSFRCGVRSSSNLLPKREELNLKGPLLITMDRPDRFVSGIELRFGRVQPSTKPKVTKAIRPLLPIIIHLHARAKLLKCKDRNWPQ